MAQGSPIFLLTLTTGNCPTNFSREASPLTPFPCKPIDIDTCEPLDPCTDVYKTQFRFMWEPDSGAYFIFPGFLEAIECTIHHCYSKNLFGGGMERLGERTTILNTHLIVRRISISKTSKCEEENQPQHWRRCKLVEIFWNSFYCFVLEFL